MTKQLDEASLGMLMAQGLKKSPTTNYDSNEPDEKKDAARARDAAWWAAQSAAHKAGKTEFSFDGKMHPLKGKSMKEEVESIDETHKLNDTVIMSYPSLKGVKGRIGEIRHGAYKGAPKTYTIDYQHPKHSAQHTSSIQLSSSQFKAHKEGTLGEEVKSVDEATMSYQDWKKKLPNDISHIDSTEEEGKSHAYKMVHTPDGKRKYKIGTYYHNSNYGDLKEEAEPLDELSIDTVKSYKAKVATNPAPSKTTSDILHKAIRRFAGKERAEDRIHHDEMVKMRGRLGIKEETVTEGEFADSLKSRAKSLVKKISNGDKDKRNLIKDSEMLSNSKDIPSYYRDHHKKTAERLKKELLTGISEETLDEATVPSHKVGDTVWATSPTNKALTMTGKVTKIGTTLTTVKHKDGTEAHYQHKLVGKEYSDLHSDPAKKYKQFQREHLEQTGELLTLTEVKYMVENANGGAGAIAQHAGINGEPPQGTGKIKKMMGNKTSIDAIVKIIAKGVKPN